nr:MAG TPA: hypothetical protein [Caudoviricetes sp.]
MFVIITNSFLNKRFIICFLCLYYITYGLICQDLFYFSFGGLLIVFYFLSLSCNNNTIFFTFCQ